jgi:hypothetical protein
MTEIKKIILHIGCEKTGSTSIQHFLYDNRDSLLEKNILYPLSLGKKNHTKFAIYCADKDKNLERFIGPDIKIDEFRNKLETEFELELKHYKPETLIISCEWLHPRCRTGSEFERLNKLLLKYCANIHVICYTRQQDKMCSSLYSTALKSGSYKAFSFPPISNENSLPYYYDFYSIAQNWIENSCVKKYIFRKFDDLKNGDVVDDFSTTFGLESLDKVLSERKNSSLNNEGVILMRALNYSQAMGELELTKKEKTAVVESISLNYSGKTVLATTNEFQQFIQKFKNSNLLMHKLYMDNEVND